MISIYRVSIKNIYTKDLLNRSNFPVLLTLLLLQLSYNFPFSILLAWTHLNLNVCRINWDIEKIFKIKKEFRILFFILFIIRFFFKCNDTIIMSKEFVFLKNALKSPHLKIIHLSEIFKNSLLCEIIFYVNLIIILLNLVYYQIG